MRQKLRRCAAILLCAALLSAPTLTQSAAAAQTAPRVRDVWIDKARHNPGEQVSVVASATPGAVVRFSLVQLGTPITQGQVVAGADSRAVWNVVAPPRDHMGYMVHADAGETKATTALDVSSDWTTFPRMGYLDSYPLGMTAAEQQGMLLQLSRRYHLNSLQFYDWMWRHEKPIPKGDLPATWTGWNGDVIAPQTVKSLAQRAKKLGMAPLPYSMSYAALQGFDSHGVAPGWRLKYASTGADWKFLMYADDPRTALWMMDPSNQNWVSHMQAEYRAQIQQMGFEGTHLDQLGNWGGAADGGMTTAAGKRVDLPVALAGMVDTTRRSTGRPAGLNAVDGFGAKQLAESASTYLYSELWERNETWTRLQSYVNKQRLDSGGKPAVIAAYANNKHLSGITSEAELGTRSGVSTNTNHTGFTGSGFVDQFGDPGDEVTLTFDAPESRRYGIVPKWSNHTSQTAWRTVLVLSLIHI